MMLLQSDLICEECQFAAQELKRTIEDEKTQQRLKRFISEEICSQLGRLRGKVGICYCRKFCFSTF